VAGSYGVLLIIALVIVSGVIAYVGDIVGRRMGRKRLSLFGMRPRHTAIVISVVSGMLITIFTLGAAMALSENVRLGFLRVSQLRSELRELRSTRGRLTEETKTLGARAKELEEGQRAAREEVVRQHAELDATKKTLDKTKGDLAREQEKLISVQQLRKGAEAAARRALAEKLRLSRIADQLQISEWKAQQERGSPVMLEARQPLDTMLVEPGLTQPQIRKRLDALVARLDGAVRGVGASPAPNEKQAVQIHHAIIQDPKTRQDVWMPANQTLNELAKGIRTSEAKNGIVLRAICLRNTHEGEAVPIDFEFFRNDRVFPKGANLGDTVIGEGLADDRIYDALVLLLRDKVGPRGQGRVMPLMKPGGLLSYGRGRESVGDISNQELFAVVKQIKQVQGRTHVIAIAKEDVWTIGPLKVELKVEPI